MLKVGVGLVLGLVLWAAPGSAKQIDYDALYGADLAAIDASAVPLWDQANRARNSGDHAGAEQLFAQLFERVPTFTAAERRRCAELLQLGQHEAAEKLCRDAVDKEASAPNLTALATAILSKSKGESALFGELAEARDLLARAQKLDPQDSFVVNMQCQLAAQSKDAGELSDCATRLERLAPDEPGTVYWSWVSAISKGHFSDAEGLIERARAAGAPPDMIAHMKEATADARPWTDIALHWLLVVLGAWAVACAALVLVGVVLSRATLRTVESWNDDSAARSRTLRSMYRAVLVLCSTLYYFSLPLVLLSVVGVAGALIFGMLAVGYVSIKLLLIAGLMAFATGAAILKSVFFRPSDEAPGVQLDLAQEPELRAALAEVAAQIGTRSVDTVYMTPDTNLSVFERKSGERCLVIGVAVLEGMPLEAFKAILAHEYGHFSNRDTAGGGFALGVRRSLLLLILGLARAGHAAPWNPAWLFANGFYRIFLRVSQGASRLQEILADRHAAEAYGGAAFAAGLRHVISCDLGFDHHISSSIDRALKEKQPLQGLWSPPLTASEDPKQLSEALNRAPTPYDSHPAPSDRIRWVEHLPGKVVPASTGADAWSLFGDRAQQERQMTLFVYQRLAEQGVRPPALPAPNAIVSDPNP